VKLKEKNEISIVTICLCYVGSLLGMEREVSSWVAYIRFSTLYRLMAFYK